MVWATDAVLVVDGATAYSVVRVISAFDSVEPFFESTPLRQYSVVGVVDGADALATALVVAPIVRQITDLVVAVDSAAAKNVVVYLAASDGVAIGDATSLYKTGVVWVVDAASATDVATLARVGIGITDTIRVVYGASLYKTSNVIWLLRPYRPRIRYITLQWRDVVSVVDYVTRYVIPVIKAIDALTYSEYSSVTSVGIGIRDVVSVVDSSTAKNVVVYLTIADRVDVSDVATVYKPVVVGIADVLNAPDSAIVKNVGIKVSDVVGVVDSVTTYRTSNILWLLRPYRPRIRYVTLQLSDVVSIRDVATVYRVTQIRASDSMSVGDVASYKSVNVIISDVLGVSDGATAKNVGIGVADTVQTSDSVSLYKTSNVLWILRPYRPRIRYVTLQASDSVSISDAATAYKVPTRSVIDVVGVSDSATARLSGKWVTDVLSIADSTTAYRVPQYKASDSVAVSDKATACKVPQYYAVSNVCVFDLASVFFIVASDVVGVEDGVTVCKNSACDVYVTCVCNVNIVGVDGCNV